MRRLVSISAAVVLAVGVSILVSLTAVTQAHSQTSSDTYSQVVDNATEGRFEAPGWQTKPASPGAYGDDYSVAAPAEDTQPARFKVNIPETGEYTVYASWPASDTHNVSTRFGVSTTSGVQWTEVDQQANGGQWIKLGTYTLEAGDSWAVQVSRADYFKELVVADAIKVVEGAQEGISGTLGAMSTETMTTDRRGRDTGMDAIRSGRRFLGVRYRFNQCSVRDGFDCSCLTKRAFARLGKRLPDDPKKQYRFGRRIARSNIRPGDLLFFNEVRRPRGIDHVGIAAPRGEILHASLYHGRVVQAPRKWVMDDFVGAQRLLPAK
jgi:cell wall-associated NlpC family hydrolase